MTGGCYILLSEEADKTTDITSWTILSSSGPYEQKMSQKCFSIEDGLIINKQSNQSESYLFVFRFSLNCKLGVV
jgi:hypothetical protein